VEDTQTSGRISVVVTPEIRPLFEREVQTFEALYPQASITLQTGTTREAVAALLGRQSDLAVVGRELEPEERTVKVKGGMELEGYRFAKDALCVIVHPANPADHVSAEELRQVYLGDATSWDRLGGGKGQVEPVVQPLDGDIGVAFMQSALGGEMPSAPAYRASDDSAVVARVRSTSGAIGFVSSRWADRGAKAVPVSALRGLPAVKADPEAVYKGEYPLTRDFELYVRSNGPRLANGLITYVTSLDGQKLVHEAGWVPTAVPVRFARRSPMLSSH
jgi:phosphate transport system substrate-binding protein